MIYRLGKCCYCENSYLITRPTPFMADVPAMMCKVCWDSTQEEYANSNGDYIGNFGDADGYKAIKKQELKEISATIDELRGLKDVFLGTEQKEEKELAKSIGWLEQLYIYKGMEMERAQLLKKLSRYEFLPGHGPDYSKMTNDKLVKALQVHKNMFEHAFGKDEDENE